jgi:hypothetical protein
MKYLLCHIIFKSAMQDVREVPAKVMKIGEPSRVPRFTNRLSLSGGKNKNIIRRNRFIKCFCLDN